MRVTRTNFWYLAADESCREHGFSSYVARVFPQKRFHCLKGGNTEQMHSENSTPILYICCIKSRNPKRKGKKKTINLPPEMKFEL